MLLQTCEVVDDALEIPTQTLIRVAKDVFNGFPDSDPPRSQGSSLEHLQLFTTFLRRDGLRPAAAAALEAVQAGGASVTGDCCFACHFLPSYGAPAAPLRVICTVCCCPRRSTAPSRLFWQWSILHAPDAPRAGCAIVAVSSLGCATEATTRLHVVGPDAWSFDMRSGISCAAPASFVGQFAGSSQESLSHILQSVQARLVQAESRTGDKRSAAGGKQGHQKTPAFIVAIVRDAIEDIPLDEDPSSCHQPSGGLTDVGLHTGGALRPTSWPLAASVARVAFEQFNAVGQEEPCFREAIVRFELWLVYAFLNAKATTGYPLLMFTAAVAHMIELAACHGSALAELGYDMAAFSQRAAEARTLLLKLQAQHGRRLAARYSLPDLVTGRPGSAGGINGSCHHLPLLAIPPPVVSQRTAADLASSRDLAQRNLQPLPLPPLLPPGSVVPAPAVLAWLSDARICTSTASQRMAPQLRAAGVERWLFESAVALLPTDCKNSGGATAVAELTALRQAVEMYQKGIESSAGGRLLVEQRSRETLVRSAAHSQAHVRAPPTPLLVCLLGVVDRLCGVACYADGRRHLQCRWPGLRRAWRSD